MNRDVVHMCMGYREDILLNKSVTKIDKFALIELDGLVKNVISDLKNVMLQYLQPQKLEQAL